MQRFQRYIHMRLRSPYDTNSLSNPRENTILSRIILDTPSRMGTRVFFTPSGNNNSPDMTVRLSIAHRAPTCVIHPTVSRRGSSLLFDRRRQIQWKRSHLSWHFWQETETARQAVQNQNFSPILKKNRLVFFVPPLWAEPRCVACSLWELFILGVPSLCRSERRQPHSSSSACRWHHP